MTAVGPVAVFGASNFPLAISVAGTDTIAAFAARCPVVVKGHPGHPGSCERIADLICHAIAKTGLPAGIFSLLQGVGHEVGRALVQHPLTTAVAFTGSLQGGRAIMDAAAARPRPIPVYAEMGSTNPVFVMPQALEDAAATIAEGYVQSVNLGVGQFCTNPGLLLLPNGPTADVFLQAVKTAAEKVAAAPMLHAGILANYENGVAHLAECKGVQRLAAGGSADPGTAACSIFVADVELLSQQPSLADELFGPASLVLRCDRVEQMVECARHLGGHLTATIHGTEQELRYHAALVRLLQRRVGRVIFNGFPTGIEVCRRHASRRSLPRDWAQRIYFHRPGGHLSLRQANLLPELPRCLPATRIAERQPAGYHPTGRRSTIKRSTGLASCQANYCDTMTRKWPTPSSE